MTPENLSVQRSDVQAFLLSPQGISRSPEALKAFLQSKGFSQEEAEKAVTDLPSYL